MTWQDQLERSVAKALREIRAMAIRSRRSIGQLARYRMPKAKRKDGAG